MENCVSAPAEEDADTGEVHDDAEHGQHHDGVRAHSHHRQSSLGAHDVYSLVQLNFTPEIEEQSGVKLFLLSCDNFCQSFRKWLIGRQWLRGASWQALYRENLNRHCTGLGKRVGPRLREYRLLASSGRGRRVYAT